MSLSLTWLGLYVLLISIVNMVRNSIIWDQSAKDYYQHLKISKRYEIINEILVKLADIKKGMCIIDLACGTGATTKKVLSKLGDTGKIYCVDFSRKMLKIAKQQLKSSNLIFINARAENFNKYIDDKVDLVLCSAAFLHFSDIEKVLSNVNKLLKPKGKFIFNLGQLSFDFKQKSNCIYKLKKLIKSVIEEEGYSNIKEKSLKKYTYDIIEELLKQKKFNIISSKIYYFDRSKKEMFSFLKIPWVNERFLKGLKDDLRIKIINKVFKRIKISLWSDRWIFFVSEKVSI